MVETEFEKTLKSNKFYFVSIALVFVSFVLLEIFVFKNIQIFCDESAGPAHTISSTTIAQPLSTPKSVVYESQVELSEDIKSFGNTDNEN